MKSVTMKLTPFSFKTTFVCLFLLVGVTSAQEQPQSMLTDPRMVVIPTRTLGEINNDIDNAKATRQLAEYSRQQAENRYQQADGTISSRKQAISNIDSRRDEAKKGKRQSEAIALDFEKKANQQAISLLNKLKDLRKSEVEAAKSQAELATISIAAFQLETELVYKRIEYDSLYNSGAGDLTLNTTQQVLRELEVRLLKLQKEQAEATQKVASRQKEIVARRSKLHEAQLKLGMPRA